MNKIILSKYRLNEYFVDLVERYEGDMYRYDLYNHCSKTDKMELFKSDFIVSNDKIGKVEAEDIIDKYFFEDDELYVASKLTDKDFNY